LIMKDTPSVGENEGVSFMINSGWRR